MESDIILEGFQIAESTHGLRYTPVIADGDSSMFAKLQENVPIWGKLVRLVSSVRCAIRMRSKEEDKNRSCKLFEHAIRNSVHHLFGNHSKCSDFCKKHENEVIEDTSIPDIIQGVSDIWKETTSTEMQEESRYEFDCNINLYAIIGHQRYGKSQRKPILAICFTTYTRFANVHFSLPKIEKRKPEIPARRWKRKYNDLKTSISKKARMDHGPEAVDSFPDLTPEQLEVKKKEFMEKHINLSDDKIKIIENATKKQSCSATWIDERKKRLTASNFGSVIKHNPSIPVHKLVQSLLYSSFKGNMHTRKGLLEESMTRVYITEGRKKSNIQTGIVRETTENHNVSVGHLEIKNLLHSKPIDLYEASQQISSFCLELKVKQLALKRNHMHYYQVQGQLNISNYPWADIVVRTMNSLLVTYRKDKH
ncbi:LOW QUALITY PROTEIN: hypothetical protein KUTeg_006602 [Tegillarca granosa]|uniref:Uncharacterized protein n=1 Tax=Tegillarca granosa TaxID=220873 RepID=A0ABQ9FAS2_TEGGR|nr:LOW QUALITY PROTEIN: hypothetical protein KUTeg_006602 [Tegillarca granosa]